MHKIDNGIHVKGAIGWLHAPDNDVPLGESGSALRFMITMSALVEEGTTTLTTKSTRSIQGLLDALSVLGVKAFTMGDSVQIVGNTFVGGEVGLRGEINGRFFSSILISAPYAWGDVTLKTIGLCTSQSRINITLDMMKYFGVEPMNFDDEQYIIRAGENYIGKDIIIEGDFANASYFFAAAAILGGKITINNLKKKTLQGEQMFLKCMLLMGCIVEYSDDSATVKSKGKLKGIVVDLKDCPEIVPTIAVVAAFAKGRSEFTNIAYLKRKECDRLTPICTELGKMGIKCEIGDDSLIVHGGKPTGAKINTYKDHRMAMAFAIAGLKIPGIIVENPDLVKKSFPEFWEELQGL